MMLLPILIIIILVYVLLNPSERANINKGFKRESKDALDILDKRFANGEISEEEYLRRRSILKEK